MPPSKPARPSRRAVPASTRQLPVTREMLGGVRGELVERMAGVERRLTGEIARVELKLTGEIARVELKLTGAIARVAGDVHDLKADVSRLGVLIEEQNARNSIVFEALHAVVEQQKRFDDRLDRVEGTMRSIVSGRRRS